MKATVLQDRCHPEAYLTGMAENTGNSKNQQFEVYGKRSFESNETRIINKPIPQKFSSTLSSWTVTHVLIQIPENVLTNLELEWNDTRYSTSSYLNHTLNLSLTNCFNLQLTPSKQMRPGICTTLETSWTTEYIQCMQTLVFVTSSNRNHPALEIPSSGWLTCTA